MGRGKAEVVACTGRTENSCLGQGMRTVVVFLLFKWEEEWAVGKKCQNVNEEELPGRQKLQSLCWGFVWFPGQKDSALQRRSESGKKTRKGKHSLLWRLRQEWCLSLWKGHRSSKSSSPRHNAKIYWRPAVGANQGSVKICMCTK